MIAIVGLSCLFPGAKTPAEFWDNLIHQRQSISNVTTGDFGVDPQRLFDPNKGVKDHFYALKGGYIRDFAFDPTLYGLDSGTVLDEINQWSLYVAREALQDSGYLGKTDHLRKTGVILGNLTLPTRSSHRITTSLYRQIVEHGVSELLGLPDFKLQGEHPHPTDMSDVNIQVAESPALLVSQVLGLGESSFCIDAACASSLYAIKLACDYLYAGKADMMLAGAVSGADPFTIHMGFSIFNAYPQPHESNRPLSQNSNGLVAAEGAGVVVLKRYEDALRDGDQIYAVIRSVGLSNDGHGKHILSPRSEGQVKAFERAYHDANIDPRTISYIECHATGTPVGDVTELQSIDTFFGAHGSSPLLGSVKSNLGHLLTAAGMASLTKVILSLLQGQLPPTVNVEQPLMPNRIVTQLQPWAGRTAAVSAFGFGGANAHLVLEYPEHAPIQIAQPLTEAVTITGMATHFGPCDTLAAFEQAIRTGHSQLIPVPAQRWKGFEDCPTLPLTKTVEGAFIEQFSGDFLAYKIPPNVEEQPIPQQTLMVKIADYALKDAAIRPDSNVAVIIAMTSDLSTNQFRGRVDLTWQLEDSLARQDLHLSEDQRHALEQLLKDSLSGWSGANQYTSFIGNIIASRISSIWNFSGPSFTLAAGDTSVFKAIEVAQLLLTDPTLDAVLVGAVDLAGNFENVALRTPSDWAIGEGSGAIVLKRQSNAVACQDRIYAVIETETNSAHDDIGYVEMVGHQDATLAVQAHYPAAHVGSIQSLIGYAGAAAGMASLIKTVLCLHHRILPADLNQGAAAWFAAPKTVRRAAIVHESYGAQITLSEGNAAGYEIKNPHITEGKQLIREIRLGGPRFYDVVLTPEHRTRFAIEAVPAQAIQTYTSAASSQQATQTHVAYLQDQQRSLTAWREALNHLPEPPTRTVIWDQDDLLEFASGRIANVFGEPFAIIDSYSRRVRLPLPPYLLVSRVTHLDAVIGEYKPSHITTEYDIPTDAWYLVDGQAPWAVAVESGQCDLLLISYLGIDFENKGERVYRLLDCTLTFLGDMPKAGDTLRYDIHINSYAQTGETLLFFFSYECYVGDQMILTMRNGCAGFFSDEELANGKGIIDTPTPKSLAHSFFQPLLTSSRTQLDYADIVYLSQGNIYTVFGSAYDQDNRNPSLRLPPLDIVMIDRVTALEAHGGTRGLGLIIAEKDLSADHWYFPCHFKDDQVLAGSLMAEGCLQIMQVFMLALGLQTATTNARFQPMPGEPQVVRCRGQATPNDTRLTYRMDVTEIGLTPQPYAKANVDILLGDKIVVRFENLGLQLVEKPVSTPERTALYNDDEITHFTFGDGVASLHASHLRKGVSQHNPNGELQLLTRVLAINGTQYVFDNRPTITSEYDVPEQPWYYRENNFQTMPYSVLMEIALQPCGFLSGWLGAPQLMPNHDVFFRNLDGKGHLTHLPDLRGKTLTNHVMLTSAIIGEDVILETYTFELSCDGVPFYTGDASFGYFTRDALTNQIGLDRGQEVLPAYQQNPALAYRELELKAHPALYMGTKDRPYARLANGRLNLIATAVLADNYIYAEKAVDPSAWFFPCHFFEDPVMPGSLGVEAILQAMQLYALDMGLDQRFACPHFDTPDQHQMVWKYRGQIVQTNEKMYLEIQITNVIESDDTTTIIGNANLWKEHMRIYTVTNIAIRIHETPMLKR